MRTAVLFFVSLLLYAGAGVYCHSAVSVDLGRNVTVNCTTGYYVEWEIARDGAGPLYIYLNNNQEALERGFVLGEITEVGEADVHRLIALGSVENNGTTIYCRQSAHYVQLASYRLTVIGPPDQPVGVMGWIIGFFPLTLSLEWQEPFSHHLHPVTNYTITSREGTTVTTTATSANYTLQHEEFDGNCTFSARGVGVQAANDIGKSEISPAIYIVGAAAHKEFAIEGSLFSQNDVSILRLRVEFPKLCMGQEMKYAVGLWEKERGDLIYHETKDSQYSGEVVMYTGSLSPLPDDKNYTALVVLETGGQNLTSLPLTLPLVQENEPERESDEMSEGSKETETESAKINPQGKHHSNSDVFLIVTVVLAAIIIGSLFILMVIGALFLKHKFSQTTQAQEAKESNNPIYEGPLYENIEERETPLPTIHPQPLSLGRRMSRGLINGVDNVYRTSPIPIPSGEREGVYAELKTGGPHNTTAEEEDAYTIMSPVSRAATAINSTPYVEDRAAWIGNGK